jgi:hypothetical protein
MTDYPKSTILIGLMQKMGLVTEKQLTSKRRVNTRRPLIAKHALTYLKSFKFEMKPKDRVALKESFNEIRDHLISKITDEDKTMF